MVLQTIPFKKGLSFLSSMKDSAIFEGSISLFSEESRIKGSVLQSDGKVYLEAILQENVPDLVPFKVIIPAAKMIDALSDWSEESFEMSIANKIITLVCGIKVTFSVFDDKMLHKTLDNLGAQVGTSIWIKPEIVKVIKRYYEFTSTPLEKFDCVFVKDAVVVTDTKCIRKYSGVDFNFPYVLHFGEELHKVVSSLYQGFEVTCYTTAFVIHCGFYSVTVCRNDLLNAQYTKYLSDIKRELPESHFSFDLEAFSTGFKRIKAFLPNKTSLLKFDFVGQKVVTKVEDHEAEFPLELKVSQPSFTVKCVNGSKFFSLLSEYADGSEVKVNTSSDLFPTRPGDNSSFLYLSTEMEDSVITPLKE